MKNKINLTLAAALLALGGTILCASAQDNNNDGPPGAGQRGPGMAGQGQRGPGQGGPGMGHHPPMPAVVSALDANHDGVIDADEIANASKALKTLDKDGDGKLSMQETMGPRPQMQGGQRGQGRGPGGNNGPGGGNNMHRPGQQRGEGDGNFPPAGPPPGDQ